MTLSTLPVNRLRGRNYKWVLGGFTYSEKTLTDVTFRDDLVMFHTRDDFEGFTFGLSVNQATWREEENGDIIVRPRDEKAGEYIFFRSPQ